MNADAVVGNWNINGVVGSANAAGVQDAPADVNFPGPVDAPPPVMPHQNLNVDVVAIGNINVVDVMDAFADVDPLVQLMLHLPL